MERAGPWIVTGSLITFPHCMYPVEKVVPGLQGINYPDVCQKQPITSKHAFYMQHHEVATEAKFPLIFMNLSIIVEARLNLVFKIFVVVSIYNT